MVRFSKKCVSHAHREARRRKKQTKATSEALKLNHTDLEAQYAPSRINAPKPLPLGITFILHKIEAKGRT